MADKEATVSKSFTKLYKKLGQQNRKLLSYARDEIEHEIYWETRNELLNKIKRFIDEGRDAVWIKNWIKGKLKKPELKPKER